MPEQLTFELLPPEPPTFESFVAGRNAEALAAVDRAARGNLAETGLLLWGAAGGGKTHLLRAAGTLAAALGRPAAYHATPDDAPDTPPQARALVAVDAIDRASPEAQARLFTLYNALSAQGGQLLAAARVPPARMSLREDLRTRLGWGLVYEIEPLADDDKRAALTAWARERGFALPGEVVDYLMLHGRRDMTSLVAVLAGLDRHSLATKRPVSLPLLRTWMQRDLD